LKYSLAAAAAALLLFPAAANAQHYPEPKEPGKIAPKPKGPFKTYTVCKKKHRCDFRTIQKAVNKAKAGDKIKVKPGVYREQVLITGRKKRYLRIIGNPAKPRKVVLNGGNKKQNGFFVNQADQVTINGFMAKNYRSNGFFVTNAVGYKLTHLVAAKTGVYGIYAFNSKGGEMSHSEAYYHSDAGFYIGQTPQQDKPIRSVVRDVKSWGNAIGFSATNMRYVTITDSSFFNNGLGLIPNALESEKFPPAEDNVITGNKIFWNNFNFHAGAPFKVKNSGVVPLVPIGTGLVLLGGRGNLVEDNDIFGHYLAGVAAVEGVLLDKTPEARALINNQIKGNRFGLGGTDTNGRDESYDGNGSGNCWGPNEGVQVMWPGDAGMYPACPFAGNNAFSSDAQSQILGYIGENALKGWVKHPHPKQGRIKPLEVYKKWRSSP
jgi:hypothetical protein